MATDDRPITNALDGGEAILEAFRNLGIDYVISSPGSEWAPFWEALARQKANNTPGPTYIDCGHETLAVNIALGYTQMTGRMQAVLLHAGTGLLQGSMAIHGALVSEVPMIVMSGEALGYGEDPDYEPGAQWIRSLSVVGGPQRLVEPLVKWANQGASIHTLYQSTIRAGEIAQRQAKGPTYLCMPMEIMMETWTAPAGMKPVAPPSIVEAPASDIEAVAALILAAQTPMITTEAVGRDPQAFQALVALADLMAMPVVEGRGMSHANFPKDHALYLGGGNPEALLKQADLIIVLASRVPFYPARNTPRTAKIVVISDNPHKAFMVYQDLHADHYVEGDVASSLRHLTQALIDRGTVAARYQERRARWQAEHDRIAASLRTAEDDAPRSGLVDPIYLCACLREAMPDDTIYIDETVVYANAVQSHLPWTKPQSFFRTPTGLGQGLGVGLGVKLAAPGRPVVVLTGDGSFLYSPALAALGAAKANNLPILVLIFNNREYRSMRRNHLALYPGGLAKQTGIHHGNKLDSLDYAELAKTFGGFGRRIGDAAELPGALREALAAIKDGSTAILDVEMTR
jgi:thiamine pyrophosphate-dependent acetolactate synthase large subunit-like protein